MTIVPDTKDWTWVLQRPCPECGFDTSSFPVDQVPELILSNAASWHRVLTGPGDLRTRPAPGTWSPVEYGCHVRDVFRLFDRRLELMLSTDDPLFPNWDQTRPPSRAAIRSRTRPRAAPPSGRPPGPPRPAPPP